MSGVSIPRWSICLKPRVRGKGSLTKNKSTTQWKLNIHILYTQIWILYSKERGKRTEDETGEEEIDPAHDKHLRDHGSELVLHAPHHAFHHGRVSEGAHRGWCDPVAVLVALDRLRGVNFEIVTLCKGMCEVIRQCCKVRGWNWGGLCSLAEELGSEESAPGDDPKRWARSGTWVSELLTVRGLLSGFASSVKKR